MARPLASLRSRVFAATAVVAVVPLAAAFLFVTRRVAQQAEVELTRGLDEAARLVGQYHGSRVETATERASLVADLPRLKAAVATGDPPTVEQVASEYRASVRSDVFAVADRAGRTLASLGAAASSWPAPGGEAAFHVDRGRLLETVSVPILLGEQAPERLGHLTLGFALDDAFATRLSALTGSHVAVVMQGRVFASTLPRELDAALAVADATRRSLDLAGEDYAVHARGARQRAGRAPRARAALARRGAAAAAHAARRARGGGRGGGRGEPAAELGGGAHGHAAARGADRRDEGDRRDGRPGAPPRARPRVGRRGRAARGAQLRRPHRLDRPLPARGLAARAALGARPALHRRGARGAQPADDHQGVAARAAARERDAARGARGRGRHRQPGGAARSRGGRRARLRAAAADRARERRRLGDRARRGARRARGGHGHRRALQLRARRGRAS